jgi:hypothetical protein
LYAIRHPVKEPLSVLNPIHPVGSEGTVVAPSLKALIMIVSPAA